MAHNLSMPELFMMASNKKDWKRISAESPHVSPWQPNQSMDSTELITHKSFHNLLERLNPNGTAAIPGRPGWCCHWALYHLASRQVFGEWIWCQTDLCPHRLSETHINNIQHVPTTFAVVLSEISSHHCKTPYHSTICLQHQCKNCKYHNSLISRGMRWENCRFSFNNKHGER